MGLLLDIETRLWTARLLVERFDLLSRVEQAQALDLAFSYGRLHGELEAGESPDASPRTALPSTGEYLREVVHPWAVFLDNEVVLCWWNHAPASGLPLEPRVGAYQEGFRQGWEAAPQPAYAPRWKGQTIKICEV